MTSKLITQGDILRSHREALGLTIDEAVELNGLKNELPNPPGMTDAEMLYIFETDQAKLNNVAIGAICKALQGADAPNPDGTTIAGKSLDVSRLVAAAEADESRTLKVAGLSGLRRAVAVRLSGLISDMSEEELGGLLEFLVKRPLSVESKIKDAVAFTDDEGKKGRRGRRATETEPS